VTGDNRPLTVIRPPRLRSVFEVSRLTGSDSVSRDAFGLAPALVVVNTAR